MKSKLAIALLFSFFIVNVSCKKEEEKVKESLTSPSYWSLTSALLDGESILDWVDYCGKSDKLYFYEGGDCEVVKNGCNTLYGTYTNTESELILSKDGESYNYSIVTLDDNTLIIETEVYAWGGYYTLKEIYSAN